MISRIIKVEIGVISQSQQLKLITPTETLISNGNRTEWSPIRSVIIRVITKSDTAQRESDLLITSMITDHIGQHEVLPSVITN